MARPNVLFVLIDDLGWGDVSYHGSAVRTPNIDRLVYRGIELDSHYVNPVCTPTRVSLLTGRFPGRFGRHATVPSNPPVLPDGYPTLATMFRSAGYATALFGKWHLGSDPRFYPGNYGFDESYGSLAGGVDPYRHTYKRGPHCSTWHHNGTLIQERGHATDLITGKARRWIEAQAGPWFCYVPYTAVHTPIRAPEQWIDRYWFEHHDYDPKRDYSFREYAAYASHLDRAIGTLIETLKCLDQLHNTVVVLVSDNGASTKDVSADTNLYPGWHEDMPRRGSNYPLRGTKGTLYEGGIRVPAAIMWPSVLSPYKCCAPIHVADWMPTFAALLDCDLPSGAQCDGVNVWPAISGQTATTPERTMYWNLVHRRFAVRHGGWKLILRERESGQETELYHIDQDPLEEQQVSSRYPDKVEELAALLAQQRTLDDTSKRTDVE